MNSPYFNKNLIFTQKITDFELLLKYLRKIQVSDTNHIMEVERQASDLLRETGEDINGLLVIALVNLYLGHRQRAISIVHRIWELGGEFSEFANVVYVDMLLGFGLLEMASMLLKEKFENVEQSVDVFGEVMMKFAVETGNLNLMKRVYGASSKESFRMLQNFVAVYEEVGYAEHFKMVQKIAHEFFKDEIYGYDYAVYNDRGFTDVEVFIYLGKETTNFQKASSQFERGVEKYFEDKGVKRIYNLGFVLKDIKDYPSLERDL